MEGIARVAGVVSPIRAGNRADDCGNAGSARILSVLPTALGSLGHLYAYASGRLGDFSRLFGDVSTIQLSMAYSGTEQSNRGKPNVDDVGCLALCLHRLLRIARCGAARPRHGGQAQVAPYHNRRTK